MFPSPVSAMKPTIRQAGTRINAPKNLRGRESFRKVVPEGSLLDLPLKLNVPAESENPYPIRLRPSSPEFQRDSLFPLLERHP